MTVWIRNGEIPEPARNQNNIPIIMSSSEAFLPYACVTIYSVLEHSQQDKFYDIILLNQGYSEQGLALLKSIVDGHGNCMLRLLNVRQYIKEKMNIQGHVSVETYYRLLIPTLFQRYSDVLYLDSDLVICKDISELLLQSDRSALLSGILDLDVIGQYYGPEFSAKYYINKKLELPNPDNYLQAGVLVFHISQIRKVFEDNTFMWAGVHSKLRYVDQDVLNYCCKGQMEKLDWRWNVVCDCADYRVRNIIAHAPPDMYEAYLQSRLDPWIVHYSGYKKPWDDPESDMAVYFWNSAQRAGIAPLLRQQVERKQGRARHDVRCLMISICSFFCPKQSRRREVLKVIYYHFAYYKPKQGKGSKRNDGK